MPPLPDLLGGTLLRVIDDIFSTNTTNTMTPTQFQHLDTLMSAFAEGLASLNTRLDRIQQRLDLRSGGPSLVQEIRPPAQPIQPPAPLRRNPGVSPELAVEDLHIFARESSYELPWIFFDGVAWRIETPLVKVQGTDLAQCADLYINAGPDIKDRLAVSVTELPGWDTAWAAYLDANPLQTTTPTSPQL